ncbi:PAS domain S-box protein [Natronorubrum thiooxidans]|uniref:histidine kinase n=1 Tax=Natronorubrum thiooxidans TaxID=308853 RepID=A0A1N7H6S6_9EURY|nr:PAS domain S-box protein [Natronorubrum thiooxidans]SIS20565.1 PAS domain S-box-containing protein [Natronorubrum thiooxidans]
MDDQHKSDIYNGLFSSLTSNATEVTFFKELVANASDGFLTIDEESRIVFANPAIEAILGYTPSELIGRSKLTLIPERLRSAHERGLEAYIRTGETHIDWSGIELPALHKDGHEVPVRITLQEHSYEGQRLFTGIFRDLSERKTRQRRFEAVFNNTYQFTGLVDCDGIVIEANETALSFADLDRADVVGKPLWETYWFQLTEEATRTARLAVEHAKNGEFFREEIRIQGSNRTAVIDFSIRPITDSHGETQLLIPEGREITELKLRRQHFELLHRLFRHNLRNDLNIINGFAELLAQALTDDDLHEYATRIVETSSRLITINETAKELADITLNNDYSRTDIDVQDALEKTVAELHDQYPKSSIEVATAVNAVVPADARLRTVFIEILENAIVHTDEPRPSIEVRLVHSSADETIGITVVDSCPAIPETERVGTFNKEPVTQLKHSSGMGLWLARLIVEDYGGYLNYERRADNSGNRITIHLPVIEDV